MLTRCGVPLCNEEGSGGSGNENDDGVSSDESSVLITIGCIGAEIGESGGCIIIVYNSGGDVK